jgi:hypothetical protein
MARKLREGKIIGSEFDRTAILQKISWEKAREGKFCMEEGKRIG